MTCRIAHMSYKARFDPYHFEFGASTYNFTRMRLTEECVACGYTWYTRYLLHSRLLVIGNINSSKDNVTAVQRYGKSKK